MFDSRPQNVSPFKHTGTWGRWTRCDSERRYEGVEETHSFASKYISTWSSHPTVAFTIVALNRLTNETATHAKKKLPECLRQSTLAFNTLRTSNRREAKAEEEEEEDLLTVNKE